MDYVDAEELACVCQIDVMINGPISTWLAVPHVTLVLNVCTQTQLTGSSSGLHVYLLSGYGIYA